MLRQPFTDGGQRVGLPERALDAPELFDGLLDAMHRQMGRVAVGGLELSPGADVVLVGVAVGSGVDAIDEPGPASSAVQRPRQVVQVLPLAVVARAVPGEAILDTLEGVFIDQRLVDARIFDSSEGREAKVVAVRQHPVDMAALKVALGLLGGGADRQPAIGQEIGELGQRHIGIVGVDLEGPADVIGTLIIDDDLASGTAVDDGLDVGVADRCTGGGAAIADLLLHALDDLLGQVLAIEVGDGREDAVDELALWGLVDVFSYREEPDPVLRTRVVW